MKLKKVSVFVLAMFMLLVSGCNFAPIVNTPVDIEPLDTPEPIIMPTETPTIEPTLEPAPEPTPTPKVDPNPDFPYYLYVEKGSFTLTIYEKDENFEYTKIYKQYRIAHGGNKTPNGKFELTDRRERCHHFPKGGDVQFAVAYKGNLYTHSPLYAADQNPRNMWPKYYDGEKGIGTASTGGCLRMVTEAARFIYENCPPGTILEIVNGNPRGTTSPDVPSRKGLRQDPTDITVG